MVVLGLLLLVAAVAVGTAVAVANTSATSLEGFGYSLSGLTLGGIFLLGMALGALALLGLLMLLGGARRRRAKRVAQRREVESVRSEQETLAEENARLQAELEQSRSVSPYPAGDAGDATVLPAHGKHRR
ncbi:MAG: hypothetical protein EPN99_01625 [Frankiales bacterium]|nr:MAG: hypothetical protein EPN99_01625 [Frankiales bacterium]